MNRRARNSVFSPSYSAVSFISCAIPLSTECIETARIDFWKADCQLHGIEMEIDDIFRILASPNEKCLNGNNKPTLWRIQSVLHYCVVFLHQTTDLRNDKLSGPYEFSCMSTSASTFVWETRAVLDTRFLAEKALMAWLQHATVVRILKR